jgi:transposase
MMAKTITVQDFFRQFPDDSTCLDHLFTVRFGESVECPRCGAVGQFRRLRKMPAYTCNCGHHIHPMAGTPFERSRTPLQKWFYSMYLFTTSRHGVPAKELQRQLGVTYKTAWRMANEIRKYMGPIDGDDPLDGHVEVDETHAGGKRGRGAPGKTIVFGMLSRGGDLMTGVVPNVRRATLEAVILEKSRHGARISGDELHSYKAMTRHGYDHRTVNHDREEWVSGDAHVNGQEGIWAQLKRSTRGTHFHVSRKRHSKYLGEFEFWYNLWSAPELMFRRLVLSFQAARLDTSHQELIQSLAGFRSTDVRLQTGRHDPVSAPLQG